MITLSPEVACNCASLTVSQFAQFVDPQNGLDIKTIRTYHNSCRRVLREAFNALDLSLFTISLFLNFETVEKYLESDQVPSLLKKCNVTAILKLLYQFKQTPKCVEERYQKLMKKYMLMIDELTAKQQASPQEAKQFELLSSIGSRADELLEKYAIELAKDNPSRPKLCDFYQQALCLHIMGGLHEGLPPGRSEAADVQIIGREDIREACSGANYLEFTDEHKRFVLNDYKTARAYGTLEVPLPETVLPFVQTWLELNDKSKWFLIVPKTIDQEGGPTKMSRTYYARYLSKSTGVKGVSSTVLRKFFVTSKFGNGNMEERLRTAKLMGHDFLTSCRFYQKDLSSQPSKKRDRDGSEGGGEGSE